MTLGQEIRKARGDRTQTEVAATAGFHKAYLCDIEKDLRFPPPETIRKLAAVLDLEPDRWLWLWVVEQMGAEAAWQAATYGCRQEALDG